MRDEEAEDLLLIDPEIERTFRRRRREARDKRAAEVGEQVLVRDL
jgi:hypothetical protein